MTVISVSSLRQAMLTVSDLKGLEIESFEEFGWYRNGFFYFGPNDNQPEGTPGWLVSQDGDVRKITWGDFHEIMEFIESPETQVVHL